MTRWLQELNWIQIENYLKKDDVALLPVGSTEQHGPHLPLMTDAAQAIAVAEAVAKETNVVIAPPIWYGWSPHHLGFPGSITLRPETLAALVEDVIMSLIFTGFKRLIIITGHTTMNFIPINPVLLRTRVKTGAYVALVDVGLIAQKEIGQVLQSKYDGHAGEWETSFMLYAYPDKVHMDKAQENIPIVNFKLFPALIPDDPRISANTYQIYDTPEEYRKKNITASGASGNPLLASRSKGRKIFEAMVRNTVLVVKEGKNASVHIKKRFLPC